MYCVDYTNGGLGIIDLDTGAVDLLGTYSGDIGGPAITPAMCVTADGLIIVADMSGNLYTVDCDTMRTTRIGSSGADGWYYAGMTYDHDTGNIYWNPCMNTGLSPLYLVRLGTNQWSGQLEATIVDIGDVSSKNGVWSRRLCSPSPPTSLRPSRFPWRALRSPTAMRLPGWWAARCSEHGYHAPASHGAARTWSTSGRKRCYSGPVWADLPGRWHCHCTVSISNKSRSRGGPFTDTVEVTVCSCR